jgi:enterochelin esterase-like enzyme
MPLRPQMEYPKGQVVSWAFESKVLQGNPLQDPTSRVHPVYLPFGYEESLRRYPVMWSLAAYTNAGPGQVSWRNHGETLPQRLDRLIAQGEMPPVIVVFPDCYTSLGGNQYVDTPAMGLYATHLMEELIPAVDQTFKTIPVAEGRALFGKSSGGFGALHLAMTYPKEFAGVASHAGDCGFDRVYVRDFPTTCDVLSRFKGDLEAFVRAFWRNKRPGHSDFHALMTLCLGASYSPDGSQPMGIGLPFDLRTCELDSKCWARWQAFDPVRRIGTDGEGLKALRALWIDVGQRDQYHMHYGSRSLHDALEANGVPHVYEEFDGTHSGIDWRMDLSLPHLARHLDCGGAVT